MHLSSLPHPRWMPAIRSVELARPPACLRSKSDVVAAGRVIVDPNASMHDLVDAFRIAHEWRVSCIHPMRTVRADLIRDMRALGLVRGLSASRVKRMQSIRKKLGKEKLTLYQMQDIGGCRVIVESMADVANLCDRLTAYDAKRGQREKDYIAAPKEDGYRSRHVIVKFDGPNDAEAYRRHFVEIQIRTRLQHSWATAVEAVGLFENQDLKGGAGDMRWRRLFQLVSAEFAAMEDVPLLQLAEDDVSERRRELVDLAQSLQALKLLAGIRQAIRFSDRVVVPNARYFLITYNYARRQVEVTPKAYVDAAIAEYADAENDREINQVLVEVDKLADLKGAYPNYFLDVGLFTASLQRILRKEEERSRPRTGWQPKSLSSLTAWSRRK